jgi:transcriptional regulator with XRE-family HTH domain
MIDSSDILSKKLTALIKSGKISKADLCRKANLGRSNLDIYLKQTSTPTLRTLDEIANALGVPASRLIDANLTVQPPHTLEDSFRDVISYVHETNPELFQIIARLALKVATAPELTMLIDSTKPRGPYKKKKKH